MLLDVNVAVTGVTSMPRNFPSSLAAVNKEELTVKGIDETWPAVVSDARHDGERAALAGAHDHTFFQEVWRKAPATAHAG